jgi:hypothetical protein
MEIHKFQNQECSLWTYCVCVLSRQWVNATLRASLCIRKSERVSCLVTYIRRVPIGRWTRAWFNSFAILPVNLCCITVHLDSLSRMTFILFRAILNFEKLQQAKLTISPVHLRLCVYENRLDAVHFVGLRSKLGLLVLCKHRNVLLCHWAGVRTCCTDVKYVAACTWCILQ